MPRPLASFLCKPSKHVLHLPRADAEDFAFLAARVPAAFAMLGIRNESAGSVHGLHTPQFRLDEAALPLGAALHAQFAVDFLGDGSRRQPASKEEL